MRLYELAYVCRLYATVTDFDSSIKEFRHATNPAQAARFGIKAGDIPSAVGRPESSIPKLIDEYYWVTITKGCAPATAKDLERWFGWSRGLEPKSG